MRRFTGLLLGTALAVGCSDAPPPKPVLPVRPAPTPTPTPLPAATPVATPAPTTAVPVAIPEIPLPKLAVGVSIDRKSVAFSPRDWWLLAGGTQTRVRGALEVWAPAGGAAAPAFVVQAGSFLTTEGAEKQRARLAQLLGVPVRLSPNGPKTAVHVGEPGERKAVEMLLARVRREAMPDAFLVGAPVPVTAAPNVLLVRVLGEAEAREVPSPATLVPLDGGFVQVGETSYRGRLVLRATGRGTLHVINEVNLEDYLKGVVPGEMGPRVYDEIEALKAQTIAARSYAIRRLGSWAREGYDLCATPRCQVYSGVNVEQPLSSQAVDDTAGEVLVWNGTVCDTLFTSTCGGRTEFANEVFPGYGREDFPYLASVTCFGEGAATLSSTRTVAKGPRSLLALRGAAFLAFLEGDLAAVRRALREGLGLPAVAGPKSLAPESFYRDLAKAGELVEPELLIEDLETSAAPASWSKEAKSAFATLSRFQLGAGAALPTDRALTVEEAAGLYVVLLTRLGDVEEIEARFLSAADGKIELKTAAGRDTVEILPGAALFRGGPDAFHPEPALNLVAGDRVRLLVAKKGADRRAFALAGPVAAAHGTYERASSWIHWTRRFTGQELAAKLNERDASRSYERVKKIDVLSRGVSGRATKVRVETDKDTVMLSGLEIRFALGVPESLFRVVPGQRDGIPKGSLSGPTGPPGGPLFTFYGRGWGHGIGLCQNGAFGMALAGKTYREIVEHYYPGASVGPIPAPN